jgi:hypothetical protein
VKEEQMEKIMEFMDALMNSQKEFMESWVNSQKQYMDSLRGAAKTMQESLLSFGGSQEGSTKDLLNLYKSALTTMVDSSKVLTDEAEKIQETWKIAIAKQLDMNRDMVKNFSDLFKKAA